MRRNVDEARFSTIDDAAEMSDKLKPSLITSASGEASGAFEESTPSRPDPTSRPSYGSSKEPEPEPEQEQQPSIESPAYEGAGEGHEDLSHGAENAEPDQTALNPSFQPFFTIIEDAHSSVFHHPTVHYIFSDDDTDIIKEAGYRSLETQGISIPPEKDDKEFEDEHEHDHDHEHDDQTEHDPHEDKSVLPPTIPGIRTHYLIVDVEPNSTTTDQITTTSEAKNLSTSPTGPGALTSPISPIPSNPTAQAPITPQLEYRVTSAKSFSPSWQILNADLVPAPTFDSQDPNQGPSHGMMLNIRGTGGKAKEVHSKEDGLEVLMERFEKQMGELQTIIDLSQAEKESTVNEQAGDHENENETEGDIPVAGTS
ncbi:hypothetical protein PENSTE_c002G05612 [Penicillium steckii]|uniref:Anaphase-promoting complex subunit 11 RING-H2 finger domain-containing protein n=1 Tax=Penicillium steckii TaxID=303698 RepID=A0A1V6TSU6_9EURO|nr:hypothetical protein PENSTE_c002G05612 [Penicillium steckii]